MTNSRMKHGLTWRVSCAFVVVMGITGSAAAQQEEQAAKIAAATEAAEGWLVLLDDGHYDASWETAASAFQAALHKDEWGSTVRQARDPYEPFGDRALVQAQFLTSLPNMPEGEYVVLAYATDTAQGKVLETVVPMMDGGEWRVAGYFVRPQP